MARWRGHCEEAIDCHCEEGLDHKGFDHGGGGGWEGRDTGTL
jgi:hypothetical protein